VIGTDGTEKDFEEKGLGEDSSVGVTLSDGSVRATLFSLGVFLYLAVSGANRHVTTISSVSGGSEPATPPPPSGRGAKKVTDDGEPN
jgi:hypothetical protein